MHHTGEVGCSALYYSTADVSDGVFVSRQLKESGTKVDL